MVPSAQIGWILGLLLIGVGALDPRLLLVDLGLHVCGGLELREALLETVLELGVGDHQHVLLVTGHQTQLKYFSLMVEMGRTSKITGELVVFYLIFVFLCGI